MRLLLTAAVSFTASSCLKRVLPNLRSFLKPGTERNDGGTFRPVPPTKIRNCVWIKAHKTKTVITKVSSASFMVLVCKLKATHVTCMHGNLPLLSWISNIGVHYFTQPCKLTRSIRVRGTSAICEHGAWHNCMHCFFFR